MDYVNTRQQRVEEQPRRPVWIRPDVTRWKSSGGIRTPGGVAFHTVESSTVLARDKSGEEEAPACRGGREANVNASRLTDLWNHVVNRAKQDLGSATLDMLLENARPVRLESGRLTLFSTSWERDWVEARHLADLKIMCQEVAPGINEIEMLTPSDNGRAKAHSATGLANGSAHDLGEPASARPRSPRMTGGTLNPRYTFDSFVVGPSNRFAQAASLAVAEDPAGARTTRSFYMEEWA